MEATKRAKDTAKQESRTAERAEEADVTSGQESGGSAVRSDSEALEKPKKVRLGEDIFYRVRNTVYPAKVTRVNSDNTIQLMYFDGDAGRTAGVNKVSAGIDAGHWWHDLEVLEAAAGYDVRSRRHS